VLTIPVKNVIYDMDGLLLDTEQFYTAATSIIAARFGKVFDWTVKSKMMGKRATDAARVLVDELELPMGPEEYLAERTGILKQLFPGAEPLPGAVRLTRHLHRHGVPQAVATSTDRHNFELKTRRHQEWFGLFECVVIGDDPAVRHGKPAPDIFLTAAERLKAVPAECLVFEDAPAGVEAAVAAGMRVVVVPDPHMDPQNYPAAVPIIASLDDFKPGEWGLPPFPA
jgi:HAD superfamily hydrolase (TIGR01509 family)